MNEVEETDLMNGLVMNAEQLALSPEENVDDWTLKRVSEAMDELWSRLTANLWKKDEQERISCYRQEVSLIFLIWYERISRLDELYNLARSNSWTQFSASLKTPLSQLRKNIRNDRMMEMKKIVQ